MSGHETDTANRPGVRGRPDARTLEQLGEAASMPGERMRLLRRARGLTQHELALATGVSRSAVAQWETGRAGFGNRIVRVADVLGVPVRDLRLGITGRNADGGPAAPVSREEATLLAHFRDLCPADRACLLLLARRLAAAAGV